MPTSEHSATAIVARNTTYQFIGKIVTIGLSMVTFALVTRSLSVEQNGFLTLVSTIFALIIGFTDLRVDQAAIRESAQKPSLLSSLAGQATTLKLLFSLVIMSIAAAIIWLSDYHHIVKLASSLALIGVLFNSLQVGYGIIIQHQLKAYLLTVAEVISKVIVSVLVMLIAIPVLLNGTSSATTLYSYVLAMLVISPFIILVSFRYFTANRIGLRPVWSIDRQRIGDLFKQSWPLWIMGILALVHYRADTIILSMLKPEYDVGIYGVPYRLLDVTVTLPPLLIASVYPILSKYALTDKPRADQALIKTLTMLTIFVVGLSTIIFYAAPQIVTIFGGLKFEQSIGVLQILAVAMVGIYLSSVFAPYVIAFRHQWYVVIALALSVLINIGLSLWLIPALSFNGAAIATATSEMFGFICIAVIAVLKYRLHLPWLAWLKTLAAAVITLIVLQLSHLNTFVSESLLFNLFIAATIAIAAGLLYGSLVLGLRIIDKHIILESTSGLPIPTWIKNRL